MNFGGVTVGDTANGPGLRISLFVSGCTHHCPGCFNSDTWDFDYGEKLTQKDIDDIFFSAKLMSGYLQGFSLLGGEPFDQSIDGLDVLIGIIRRLKTEHSHFDFWCWSGYTFEQLTTPQSKRGEKRLELLKELDVLVDGRFVLAKKNLVTPFRGSTNQRVIDVQKSLGTGEPVLFME